MSFFRRIFSRKHILHVSLETVTPPTLKTIERAFSLLSETPSNKHAFYETIYLTDSDVFSAINKLATLVAESYEGFSGEHAPEAEDIAKRLNIEHLFRQASIQLCIHGNYIAYRENKSYRVLPIPYLTILESEDQIGDITAQIYEPNIYVLNELDESKRQIFNRKDIIHIKLDDSILTTDSLGRQTLGVWGISPLSSLETYIRWKWESILNDILWRSRNVPREHHKLDLSAYSPENYTGSFEERLRRAKSDAQNALKDYANKINKQFADQAYITGREVEITYIEPKSSNYLDPNKLIEQLNESIISALGLHESVVRGRSKQSYAAEVVLKGYTAVTVSHIAKLIARKFLEEVKRWLVLSGVPYTELSDLEIRIALTLDIDRLERIRRAAVMAGMGVFTINEIREAAGYPPLQEGGDVIVSRPRKGRASTEIPSVADVTRDIMRREKSVSYPTTPHSSEKVGV